MTPNLLLAHLAIFTLKLPCIHSGVFWGGKYGQAGTILTFAGNYQQGDGFSGDGGPATAALLYAPRSLYINFNGDIVIGDLYNGRIRKVDAKTGIITTIAGIGSTGSAGGSSGDGGPATLAQLNNPRSVVQAENGDVYIADRDNAAIRRVNIVTGIISTVVGTLGTKAVSTFGVAATSTTICQPCATTWNPDQTILYFSDNYCIKQYNRLTGILSLYAGAEGTCKDGTTRTSSGDSGPATSARFAREPSGIWMDRSGNMYTGDIGSHTVRRISKTGIITLFAGVYGTTSNPGAAGVPALQAQFQFPYNVHGDSSGNVYVADTQHCMIRIINITNYRVYPFIGTGTCGSSGDYIQSPTANLLGPSGVFVDSGNNRFVIDCGTSTSWACAVSVVRVVFDVPMPTGQPTLQPSRQPTMQPSSQPTSPTGQPTSWPSSQPSRQPSKQPASKPSTQPSSQPSRQPTRQPSRQPSMQPSRRPTRCPTRQPSSCPTNHPFSQPTAQPTTQPSIQPDASPTSFPSCQPSVQPSSIPPTAAPTVAPSAGPTRPGDSNSPTTQPSARPTPKPTVEPSSRPSSLPTSQPSQLPSSQPSRPPTTSPSSQPTNQPSRPTGQPSATPTKRPQKPHPKPTTGPASSQPSQQPSTQPTTTPTQKPSALGKIALPPHIRSPPTLAPVGTPVAAPTFLEAGQQSTLITAGVVTFVVVILICCGMCFCGFYVHKKEKAREKVLVTIVHASGDKKQPTGNDGSSSNSVGSECPESRGARAVQARRQSAVVSMFVERFDTALDVVGGRSAKAAGGRPAPGPAAGRTSVTAPRKSIVVTPDDLQRRPSTLRWVSELMFSPAAKVVDTVSRRMSRKGPPGVEQDLELYDIYEESSSDGDEEEEGSSRSPPHTSGKLKAYNIYDGDADSEDEEESRQSSKVARTMS